MLTFSTEFNTVNLLNLAEYISNTTAKRRFNPLELVEIVKTDALSLELQMRVAMFYAVHDQTNKARDLLSDIDLKTVAHKIKPVSQSMYSRIAWACYIPKYMAYDKVIPYYEKLFQCSRHYENWILNYAQALAVVGRESEAKSLVEKAYKHDSTLKNGFAWCGYLANFIFEYSPEKALLWFERDHEEGRLANDHFRILHASLFAAIGDIATALAMVEKAYDEVESLTDGYANIGWYYYAINEKKPEKAIPFFEKDLKFERIQHHKMIGRRAGLYARMGERRYAEKLIESGYAKGDKTTGGNMIVGFCDYSINKDIEYLHSMVDKDESLDRLRRPHLAYMLNAVVLFKYGKKTKAMSLIKKAADCSALTKNLAISWLKRICFADKKLIGDLFTAQVKEIFEKELK